MKEIKFLLYTLFIAGYTSLIWASSIWDGIKIGPNSVPLGYSLSIIITLIICGLSGEYLKNNWNVIRK